MPKEPSPKFLNFLQIERIFCFLQILNPQLCADCPFFPFPGKPADTPSARGAGRAGRSSRAGFEQKKKPFPWSLMQLWDNPPFLVPVLGVRPALVKEITQERVKWG